MGWTSTVPVERITAQARQVRFWRVVLTVIAGLLYGTGWLAYRVLAVAWLALAWCSVAAREGWRDARRGGMTQRAGRR